MSGNPCAMGVIGGSIDVAVVAFANAQGWPSAASFILTAYALGSLVAGLTFGALRIALPIERQFIFWILVTAVTALLPILSPNVYIMTGILFIAGLSFAPTMIIVMNLGTVILPPSKLTEGLTWMTTGISMGVALGGMLAGLVIDTSCHRYLWCASWLRRGDCLWAIDGGDRNDRPADTPRSIRDASRAGGRSLLRTCSASCVTPPVQPSPWARVCLLARLIEI